VELKPLFVMNKSN